MKYLIVEIQKMVDGTIAHIVQTADTQREAESKYHGILQYAALSDLPCHSVALLDETGNCVAHEFYVVEEEPAPVLNYIAKMSLTSLVETELDLYDEFGTVIPGQKLAVTVSEEPTTVYYEFLASPGVYYLKNADGYAIGMPDGEARPILADGSGQFIDLGPVEVIMIPSGEAK